MAITTWPTGPTWQPREMRFGASTPKSGFAAFFSGNNQTISHLSDRLRCTLMLPPCGAADGEQREAWLLGLASSGDWVTLGHLQRAAEPRGTLRGLPTVSANTAAGARTLPITTTAEASLTAGDMLQVGSQLIMARTTTVANGSGAMSLPLSLPLVADVASGAAVVWQSPVGRFQLEGASAAGIDVGWGRFSWQAAVDISLLQVP